MIGWFEVSINEQRNRCNLGTVGEKEEKNLQSTETNAKTQKGSGFVGTRTLFVAYLFFLSSEWTLQSISSPNFFPRTACDTARC